MLFACGRFKLECILKILSCKNEIKPKYADNQNTLFKMFVI